MKALQKKSRTALYRRKMQEEESNFDDNKKDMQVIATFLKKSFVSQLMLAPVDFGREVKIKAFM